MPAQLRYELETAVITPQTPRLVLDISYASTAVLSLAPRPVSIFLLRASLISAQLLSAAEQFPASKSHPAVKAKKEKEKAGGRRTTRCHMIATNPQSKNDATH